jgi:hypothetical protein
LGGKADIDGWLISAILVSPLVSAWVTCSFGAMKPRGFGDDVARQPLYLFGSRRNDLRDHARVFGLCFSTVSDFAEWTMFHLLKPAKTQLCSAMVSELAIAFKVPLGKPAILDAASLPDSLRAVKNYI